jgi:hypothetical protein
MIKTALATRPGRIPPLWSIVAAPAELLVGILRVLSSASIGIAGISEFIRIIVLPFDKKPVKQVTDR